MTTDQHDGPSFANPYAPQDFVSPPAPPQSPPAQGAEIGRAPPLLSTPPRVATPLVNPPPRADAAPEHTRVPLCAYTVFLLAPHYQAAQDFAGACLDPQQPWTYIEGVEMLEHLGSINVFVFSDWANRRDATQVMQELLRQAAQFCYDPNLLDKMPPTQVEQAPIRGPIQGHYDEPQPNEAQPPVNPMDIPPSA